MKKFSLKVIAASLALAASQAHAINVGGVVWDPNSIFDFTTTDQMVETAVTNIGDVLSGYGRITSINTLNQASFCPGCELTYVFGGYTVTNVALDGTLTFTGGFLNVYVDAAPNFDATNSATASNGDLWLGLLAKAVYDTAAATTGTLHSDPTPTQTGVAGDGRGFLDVVGGLAAANLDTDTIPVQLSADPTDLGTADFQFTSSFQLLPVPFVDPNTGLTITLFGSNDLQGDSIAIPEPGSLALIALGLLGAGVVRRPKKG